MKFSRMIIRSTMGSTALLALLTLAHQQATALQVLKGTQTKTVPKSQSQAPAVNDSKPRAPQPIKFGPPKIGPKIHNPLALQRHNAVLAVLQNQKLAADREFAAMKARVQSSAVRLPATQPPAAGSATIAPAPAGQAAKPPGTRAQLNAPVKPAAIQAPANVGPAKPLDVQSGKSPLAHAAESKIAVGCMMSAGQSPAIGSVSGSGSPATFTPEAKYNSFTISGCNFGPWDQNDRAWVYGKNGFKQKLNVDFWNEDGITVHMDPSLSGVVDQDDITLVVAPTGKQPVEKHGFKFYAARGLPGPDGNPQEVQLQSMPAGNLGLSDAGVFLIGYNQIPQKVAPQFRFFWKFQGTPVAGWVFRYAFGHSDTVAASALCFINDFGYNDKNTCDFIGIGIPTWRMSGKAVDTWDFSRLATGFAVSSYQLFTDSPDPNSLCGAWNNNKTWTALQGSWDYNFGGTGQIVVSWATTACTNLEFPTVNQRESLGAQSSYGLAVWVLGPRCVDPWTGQPDQQCVADIKQRLGQ